MSISPMNYSVANDVYGVKEAKKKGSAAEPAGVQPREEATVITPSTGDTVEFKKPADDTTTPTDTTIPTEGTPTAQKQGLNFVRISGAAALGAGAGAALALTPIVPEEEAKGGKVTIKDDKLETFSDKITSDKTHVTDADTGLKYEIKNHETTAEIGTITGEKTINNQKYTYVKGDRTGSWTYEHTLADDTLKDVLGSQNGKATIHVEGDVIKLVSEDTKLPALEWKYDAKGVLTQADSLKALTTANATSTTHTAANITAVEDFLKTTFKPETLVKDLENKFTPKAVDKLVKMTDATGGGKNIWAVGGLLAAGLALGGVAGYFLGGKPKAEPTPDAPPVG